MDPLSPATRATKKNLLLSTSAMILIKLFNINIEQIPILGVSLRAGQGVGISILYIASLYFFVCFIIYFYCDVKVGEKSNKQKDQEEEFKNNNKILRHSVRMEIGHKMLQEYNKKYQSSIYTRRYAIVPSSGGVEELALLVISHKILFLKKDKIDSLFKNEKINNSIYRTEEELKIANDLDWYLKTNNEIDHLLSEFKKTLYWKFIIMKARFLFKRTMMWGLYQVKNIVFPLRFIVIDGMFPILFSGSSLWAVYFGYDLNWIKIYLLPFASNA